MANVHQCLLANETKLWNVCIGILMREYFTHLLTFLARKCTLRNLNQRVNACSRGVNYPLTRLIRTNAQYIWSRNKYARGIDNRWHRTDKTCHDLCQHTLNSFSNWSLNSLFSRHLPKYLVELFSPLYWRISLFKHPKVSHFTCSVEKS